MSISENHRWPAHCFLIRNRRRAKARRRRTNVSLYHFTGVYPFIELFFRQQSQCQSRLLQGGAVGVSLLGDLGRILISDVWIESRLLH